jgi:hypothetical protein
MYLTSSNTDHSAEFANNKPPLQPISIDPMTSSCRVCTTDDSSDSGKRPWKSGKETTPDSLELIYELDVANDLVDLSYIMNAANPPLAISTASLKKEYFAGVMAVPKGRAEAISAFPAVLLYPIQCSLVLDETRRITAGW